MTEEEARDWIAGRFGVHGVAVMDRLAALVVQETQQQNLISEATVPQMWNRHIVDSAQLLSYASVLSTDARWIDVGSGAGFPGLVVAALSEFNVVLVEPRKRRAAFLRDALQTLNLSDRAVVICSKAADIRLNAQVISARAVTRLETLLEWMSRSATPDTYWILPKGRHALAEVESARGLWHGTFHVEHSLTDHDSLIVVASGVKRR